MMHSYFYFKKRSMIAIHEDLGFGRSGRWRPRLERRWTMGMGFIILHIGYHGQQRTAAADVACRPPQQQRTTRGGGRRTGTVGEHRDRSRPQLRLGCSLFASRGYVERRERRSLERLGNLEVERSTLQCLRPFTSAGAEALDDAAIGDPRIEVSSPVSARKNMRPRSSRPRPEPPPLEWSRCFLGGGSLLCSEGRERAALPSEGRQRRRRRRR